MAINTFTYNGSRSSSLGLYISKRTVKYPAHRTTEKPQDARDGSWMIPSLTFPAQEVVYEGFILDDVRANLQRMTNALYRQEIPARYDRYATVDELLGYKILRDTYDTDGYRLACVTAAPSVEILRNYAAAQVKITFTCLPGVYLTAGQDEIELPENTTTEITAPSNAFEAYPVIRTTGAGTIWMRPDLEQYVYNTARGDIITIDDDSSIHPAGYELVQDFRTGRMYLYYTKTGRQYVNVIIYPHVHWNRATRAGVATDAQCVPKIRAGMYKNIVTLSGTVSGTIIPNWWRM